MFLPNGTIICSLEPRRQDFSHQNKANLTFPNHVIHREQKWEEGICGMIIHTYNLCPCFLGQGFKNPWNFMSDEQCLCYANEVTRGRSLNSSKMETSHHEDQFCDQRIGTSDQLNFWAWEMGWKLSLIIWPMIYSINHAYVMTPQYKLWTLRLSGVSCLVKALMHQESDVPRFQAKRAQKLSICPQHLTCPNVSLRFAVITFIMIL